MKKLFLLSILALMSLVFYAKEIPQDVAQLVAKNFLYEQTGVSQNEIKISADVLSTNKTPLIYVFNIDRGGFVLVSADDLYKPVIAYSLVNKFDTENMPENVAWLISLYEKDIEYVVSQNIKSEKSELWKRYNKDYADFSPVKATTDVTLSSALWNQGNGYNDYCPVDDGPNGRAYTGCVATAMSIIMKYWEYPIRGNHSHTYTDYGHGDLSANFATTYYMWEQMPETDDPTLAIALLMYHAGVSVEMNYGGDTEGGSGAYSYDVPDALEYYFRYDPSVYHTYKSSYSNTEWFNLIKTEIDNARLVYYSGSGAEGGHAFVCDGYNTSDYLHFNFGWGGYNNGFYDINGSSFEFSDDQAAVVNIMPGDDAYKINGSLPAVTNVVAGVDTNNLSTYKNIITWEAPTSGSPTGYYLYRDSSVVQANISPSVLSAEDTPSEIDDYYYTVRPKYSEGFGRGSFDIAKAYFKITFRVYDENNSNVHQALIDLDGQQAYTGFGTAYFNDVKYGGPYHYTITKDGLPTTNGTIDFVYKDMSIIVIMGVTSIEENSEPIIIYPNPTSDFVHITGLKDNYKVEVYDANGKLITMLNNPNSSEDINMENCKNGVYFFKIKTKNQTFVQTIILNK